MLDFNSSVFVSADFLEYLKYEANRRHITVEEVYQDELAAEKRARAKALGPDELEALARESKPDQRRLEADEEYPF
jgi:hypothetical protein